MPTDAASYSNKTSRRVTKNANSFRKNARRLATRGSRTDFLREDEEQPQRRK